MRVCTIALHVATPPLAYRNLTILTNQIRTRLNQRDLLNILYPQQDFRHLRQETCQHPKGPCSRGYMTHDHTLVCTRRGSKEQMGELIHIQIYQPELQGTCLQGAPTLARTKSFMTSRKSCVQTCG